MAEAYLSGHKVVPTIEAMLNSLKDTRPENPYAAMAKWLAENAAASGGLADSTPKRTTGLLDSTEGASTTQYVAPQSTAGVDVAGSSVADVQLAGGRVAPGFPRTREAGPTYIVEHLEQVDADGKRMSPWCKCEYMHMYDRVGREKLLFTNMDKESSDWLTSNEGPRDGADLRIETRTVAQMVESGEIDKSRVCLLDMRGEKALCPEDADSFDYVLLGGLLGDDPPQGDITGLLRVEGFTMRHLNERQGRSGIAFDINMTPVCNSVRVQMPTNIALIVCDKILTDGHYIDELPFVDDIQLNLGSDPHVEEITQLPFRYLRKEDGKPLLAPGFVEYLQSDDCFF